LPYLRFEVSFEPPSHTMGGKLTVNEADISKAAVFKLNRIYDMNDSWYTIQSVRNLRYWSIVVTNNTVKGVTRWSIDVEGNRQKLTNTEKFKIMKGRIHPDYVRIWSYNKNVVRVLKNEDLGVAEDGRIPEVKDEDDGTLFKLIDYEGPPNISDLA